MRTIAIGGEAFVKPLANAQTETTAAVTKAISVVTQTEKKGLSRIREAF